MVREDVVEVGKGLEYRVLYIIEKSLYIFIFSVRENF